MRRARVFLPGHRATCRTVAPRFDPGRDTEAVSQLDGGVNRFAITMLLWVQVSSRILRTAS